MKNNGLLTQVKELQKDGSFVAKLNDKFVSYCKRTETTEFHKKQKSAVNRLQKTSFTFKISEEVS